MTDAEIQRLIYELQIHQVELELQNEQLREAQLNLSLSQERFADLYDFAPFGYVILDRREIVIECNLSAAAMLGVGRDSLVGSRFSDFIAPSSQDAAFMHWQEVFSSAEKQLAEIEMLSGKDARIAVRLESIAFDSPLPPGSQCRVAMIDITDLQEMKDSLVAFNETLERRVNAQVDDIKLMARALANLNEGVLITRYQGDWPGSPVLFANAAMCELLGLTSGEMIDVIPDRLLGKLTDVSASERIRDEIGTVGLFEGKLDFTCADGELGEIELSVLPLPSAHDEAVRLVSVLRDTSQRKRYEFALRERKERLQAIQDAVQDAIITINQQGIIEDCNPAIENVFGYAPAELQGRNISMLMPESDAKHHDGFMRRYLETGESFIIGRNRDLIARHRDGHNFPIRLSVSEVDHLGLYTGVISDVSRLHELQREVLRAAGEVQWRIGQALHDGPQQSLAGLGLVFRGLALELERQGSPQAAKARLLGERLGQVNEEVRLLGKGLIPVQVGSSGLVTALDSLANEISDAYGLPCEFKCPEPVAIEDQYVMDQFYHIAREAALNAARHSGADHISICLDRQGRTVSLQVIDDGSGFKTRKPQRGGLGLHIMPYRAATIGASLTISHEDAGGTVVDCTLEDVQGLRDG